jgi:cytochrome b561
MALRNTAKEFGSLARWLHWLITIGILVLVYLGLDQASMDSGPEKLAARETHGAIALIVFALMTVRLAWRFMNEVPAHPDNMPTWQRASATIVHWGIYVAVFVQLISGPITVATGGRAIPFFNFFSISLPIEKNEDKHHFWEEIHEFAWKIGAALIVVHTLAALYNHFVAKNDVLRRMTVGIEKE